MSELPDLPGYPNYGASANVAAGGTLVIYESWSAPIGRLVLSVNSSQATFEADVLITSDGTNWHLVDRFSASANRMRVEFFPPRTYRILLRNTAASAADMRYDIIHYPA